MLSNSNMKPIPPSPKHPTVSCDMCDQEFDNQNDLQKHIDTVRIHVCRLCGGDGHGRRFESHGELVRHFDSCHLTPASEKKRQREKLRTTIRSESLNCKVCNHKMESMESLRNHMTKKHPEVEIHKCSYPTCNLRFFDQEKMLDHLKRIHESIWKCPHCPKTFVGSFQIKFFKQHVKSHESESCV